LQERVSGWAEALQPLHSSAALHNGRKVAAAIFPFFVQAPHRQLRLFDFSGMAAHGFGTFGTDGCIAPVGCTLPPLGDIAIDPEFAGGGESVSPDDVVAMGASIGGDTPTDPPPTEIVGVTASASNAEDAVPALPRLLASAAAAAPPITVERMMNFLFGDFSLKIFVCGITALDTDSP